jgi:phosphohistidine phosphatase SixA
MKKFIGIIAMLFACCQLYAQIPNGIQSTAKIFIVRHAEKESGTDPGLTDAGKKRAGDLLQLLRYKGIQRIYTSQFKRTQMTGDSLRLQLNIDTVHYAADTTGDDIYSKILSKGDGGKHILIIGHSNTVLKIIRKLGAVNFPAGNIPDEQFNNLYIITFKKGRAVVRAITYGSPSAGGGQKM